MKTMTKWSQLGLAAAGAVAIGSTAAMAPQAAQAASVTYETPFFSFDQDTELPNDGFLGSSLLPYFNTALGTLNSVTYQFLGDSTVSVTFTNNSKKDSSGYASADISSYGYLRPQGTYFGGSPNGAFASVSGPLAKNGGSLTDSQSNNWYGSGPYTETDPYYLSLFQGTGDYGVDFYGYFNAYSGSNSPNTTLVAAAMNNIGARVVYDYTPTAVPTPALLPGLLGLGAGVLRKRKAEASEEAPVEV
ncbi:MAG TPA: PTPA-CTERM sorting domain-containing protein [Leptolyngbyaceae cyanobacterium]